MLFGQILDDIRKNAPLVHNITNYVTVNDCANILLACGASPIMADDMGEAEEITSICGALNINIGTLNQNTIPAMFAAGKRANALGHPVVLDPVGAGASELRTDTARRLVKEIDLAVIRGNISEMKALAAGGGNTKGVDADVMDAVSEDSLESAIRFVMAYAAKRNAVVAVTGAIDIVADDSTAYVIRNGHPDMSRITGTGCMLTCLIAASVAACPQDRVRAAAAAVCMMGIAGELAHERLSPLDGNASYRNYIIDAIYRMDGARLDSGAKAEKVVF